MLHPGNRVIGNSTNLARSRQFSERGFQSELEKLARAQCDGMAIDAVASGRGAVAHAASQIHKYPGMQHLPLFTTAGAP